MSCGLADDLRARMSATVADPVPLASDMRRPASGKATAAAVLIAITARVEPGVILTQRPDGMRHHAGQVAFPGGRVDPEDIDATAAALREAEEEVALARDAVEIVGTLAPYRTVTDFDIVPVLGVIAPDLPLVPHDREVAAVFEVPLGYVLDPANHVQRETRFAGETRYYVEIPWDDDGTPRRIWGATAAILVNLAARLRW